MTRQTVHYSKLGKAILQDANNPKSVDSTLSSKLLSAYTEMTRTNPAEALVVVRFLSKNHYDYIALRLSRLLYESPHKHNTIVVNYAWALFRAIRRARRDSWAARQEGDRKKASEYRTWVAKWIQEWAGVSIPSDEEKLLKARLRYAFKETGTERHLADSFKDASARFKNNPEDRAALQEYGWILHDCLIQSSERLKKEELTRKFLDAFRELQVPDDEAELLSAREQALDVGEAFLLGSNRISFEIEAGNFQGAILQLFELLKQYPINTQLQRLLKRALYQLSHQLKEKPDGLRMVALYGSALQLLPEDESLQTSLAWELAARLKDIAVHGQVVVDGELREDDEASDGKTRGSKQPSWRAKRQIQRTRIVQPMMQMLSAIGALNHLDRSSRALRQLLRNAIWASNRGLQHPYQRLAYIFLNFIEQWDLSHLLEEDFQPYQKGGRNYSSLAERIVPALYKAMKLYSSRNLPEGVTVRTPIQIEGLPELVWKESEKLEGEDQGDGIRHWVADFIGKQVEEYPQQKMFPYYYGRVLGWTGRMEEARQVLLQFAQLNQAQFWVWSGLAELYKDQPRVQLALLARARTCPVESDHFLKGVIRQIGELLQAHPDFRELDMDQLAWEADIMLVEQLPVQEAILEGIRRGGRSRKSEAVIGVHIDGQYETVRVFTDEFSLLAKLPLGTPLAVRLVERDGQRLVISIEKRDQGEPWDVYPSRYGVVTGWTDNKKVVYVQYDPQRSCQVDTDKIPAAKDFEIGDPIEIKIFQDVVRGVDYARRAVKLSAMPELDFCRNFEGELTVPEGKEFGFIEDIYFPPKLLHEMGAKDGTRLAGLAMSTIDRKTLDTRWRALTSGVMS